MDAAKAAIGKITSNRGHHTTVEESVNPAVTRETVRPHRHEEATQAVDREVHQHHYHTTVQPVQHKEHLPEKHTHNLLPAEHREFHHDNEHDTKEKLATHLGHFKDSSRTEQVHHTQNAAPTVTGEHVHHHVHETVVPVIHKETIQPEVVHTTIPVHETHHAAAEHHGLSALPMKTLDEFKQAGGVLTGGTHGTREEYDGQPRKYNDKLATTFEKLGLGHGHDSTGTTTGTHSHHHQTDSGVGGVGDDYNSGGLRGEGLNSNSTHHTTGGSNLGNNQLRDGVDGNGVASRRPVGGSGVGDKQAYNGSSGIDSSRHTGGGYDGSSGIDSGRRTGGATGDLSRDTPRDTTAGRNTGTTGTKPSLMDRLNPMKDADGDGKRGLGD